VPTDVHLERGRMSKRHVTHCASVTDNQ
jgi:hypothetical protein